ncbi:ribonuclease H-like domain-containing protein [Rhizophagus clarus]|uniref:Ribonuclease H-like domain-containing protein n=1 Tax=Rhizophagus clarus TaxID=94130 RepID=A0A8H3LSJ5_9GLOM|nr:ribonuclease H-like domain-containing protein [Rhizophagus clarus]
MSFNYKPFYFEIYAELFEVETISSKNNDINNPNKRLRRESTGSVFNTISRSSSSTNSTKITIGPLDSFVAKPLATLSARFSLQWVENKEIQELFYFLNPALKLPGHKALEGRILDDESKILENEMTQKLKDDPIGITLSFDAIDISGDFERWKEVVEKTEAIFEEINKMGVKFIAVITDNASSYAAARRRLRLKYVHITFLSCFAHQMNLFVGEIFKESDRLKQASMKAIKIALYFKSPNNKYFIGHFRTLQKESYGKYIQIAIGNDTRSIAGSKFEPLEQLTSRQSNDPLYLPANISSILLDETWWQSLSELKEYDDLEFGIKMKQPLLLLSWLLHPKYKMTKFKDNVPNLNHVYLSKWLIYYYEAWAKTKSKSILREFESYRKGLYSFDEQTINQFENNILSYWEWVFPLAKELGYVAQRIFGICVNVASVERLWSSMGFLHIKRHNKLHKAKENIAEPIIPNDEENLNLEIENKNQNSNDGEDIEENNKSQITSNWNNLINMWDQLLLQEKVAEE